MGGVVGSLLTGFLAKNSIVLMGNDSSINGGAIDGNVCLTYICLISITIIISLHFSGCYFYISLLLSFPSLLGRLSSRFCSLLSIESYRS